MKKSDWIFIASVLLYSILFWKQMPGINFLAFTGILLTGQVLLNRSVLKKRNWLIAAGGALFSAFFVMYYGNPLSVFAVFFSMLMCSYFAFVQKGSVPAAIFSSFISIASSIGFMVVRIAERRKERIENTGNNRGWKKILIVMIALVVVTIFFAIYRNSNLLFYNLTEKINFDWISFGWIFFTFFGALVVYGFYYHKTIPGFAEWDAARPVDIDPVKEPGVLDNLMSIDSERFSGIVLLSLLNIMLLVVNTLDLNFIFGGDRKLPQGISWTEYLHQGVGMLIFSIILAMLIILYYFRGRMNFQNSKALRALAFLWIVQNALMLLSTAWRNEVYVSAFGLTYKRIGVYIYLLLALIGLIVTAWKVQSKKTNIFLIRMNSWLFYGVWIISCAISWDEWIMHYNTQNKVRTDLVYLNSLSGDILPQLVDYSISHPAETEKTGLRMEIPRRTYLFLCEQKYLRENAKWPSFVLKAAQSYNALKDRSSFGECKRLNVYSTEMKDIWYFEGFKEIIEIDAGKNDLTGIGEAWKFPNLGVLDLTGNPGIVSLQGIEKCQKLEYLNLNQTSVTDYSPLLQLKNLKRINVDIMGQDMQDKLLAVNPELQIVTYQNRGE
jgi:hypothetical protein